jgi:hypothetical protein
MSPHGPFLPFAALHQFDRSWRRSGNCADIVNRSKLTDSVEEVGEQFEIKRSGHSNALDGEPLMVSGWVRLGIGISFASFRRFWAVAARRNLSRAPFGPLSLSRSSLRMRFEKGEQHFNFLAQSSRGAAFPRACDLTCPCHGRLHRSIAARRPHRRAQPYIL